VVGNIDELADGGGGGIDAENLGIEILPAGAGRRADPVVLANNNSGHGDRITVGRSTQIRAHARGLVILGQLRAVQEINDVGITGGPLPIVVDGELVRNGVRRSVTDFEGAGIELKPVALTLRAHELDGGGGGIERPDKSRLCGDE
jgi:hypothetical protein